MAKVIPAYTNDTGLYKSAQNLPHAGGQSLNLLNVWFFETRENVQKATLESNDGLLDLSEMYLLHVNSTLLILLSDSCYVIDWQATVERGKSEKLPQKQGTLWSLWGIL